MEEIFIMAYEFKRGSVHHGRVSVVGEVCGGRVSQHHRSAPENQEEGTRDMYSLQRPTPSTYSFLLKPTFQRLRDLQSIASSEKLFYDAEGDISDFKHSRSSGCLEVRPLGHPQDIVSVLHLGLWFLIFAI